jgi:DNA-binding XRE family transcriptional regulator
MSEFNVSKAAQAKLIAALTPLLQPLRAKVGISQGELAPLLGVSRQTYSAIECEKRPMSWNTYMSLLFFYDNNDGSREFLRASEAYPREMLKRFNAGRMPRGGEKAQIAGIPDEITDKLDETALHAVRAVLIAEYARCAGETDETVLKTFSGLAVMRPEPGAARTVKTIRKKNKKRG